MTNAEFYTTPNERAEGFCKFCMGVQPCEACPCHGSKCCQFTWLELPYDSDNFICSSSFTCPDCGKPCHLHKSAEGVFWYRCDNTEGCGFCSIPCWTAETAASAFESSAKFRILTKGGKANERKD